MPGEKLSNFMLLSCLEQLISEPTHFPRDDIETCIDLIFTDKPSAFVDSGVIPSPDPKCKHQVIHGTVNFSVPCPPLLSVRSGNMTKQTFLRLKIGLDLRTGTGFLSESVLMIWSPFSLIPSLALCLTTFPTKLSRSTTKTPLGLLLKLSAQSIGITGFSIDGSQGGGPKGVGI